MNRCLRKIINNFIQWREWVEDCGPTNKQTLFCTHIWMTKWSIQTPLNFFRWGLGMKLHGTVWCTLITYKDEKFACILDACFVDFWCSLSRYMPIMMHKMTVSRITSAMMPPRISPVVLGYSPMVKRTKKLYPKYALSSLLLLVNR